GDPSFRRRHRATPGRLTQAWNGRRRSRTGNVHNKREESMKINRRQLMAGTAGLIGTAALGKFGLSRPAFAQGGIPTYTPEPGAQLRLLRWVPFVAGEEEAWNANTRAFTEATGVEVRIEQESWAPARPKAAAAPNTGFRPDAGMRAGA